MSKIDSDYYENEYEEKLISMLNNFKNSINNSFNQIQDSHIYEITVKPKSQFLLLFEKTDDESILDLESEVVFSHSISEVYNALGSKFKVKKNKLTYNGQKIQIIETIVDHPSGMLLKYQNFEKQYDLELKVNFDNISNIFQKLYPDLDKSFENMSREIISNDEINLKIKPGESHFIDLRKKNLFEEYILEFKIEYKIYS